MKGLGLDTEVKIRRRGALYEVAYWWFFGEEQGAQPTMRYYKREGWVAKTLCEGFPWACAGSKDDVRAYVESPFSLPAVIWLTAVASVSDAQRGREMLDFLLFESFPTAAFDLMFESITWDLDCDQFMIKPEKASRLMRDVLELGIMAQRELKRMRQEGLRPPKFSARKPIEVAIKGDRIEVRGLGVDVPILTYEARDGKAMAEVMCNFFDCAGLEGGVATKAEGAAMETLLTWTLVSMLLKPHEYRGYMHTLLLYGVPDSAVRMIGYMLCGLDELLLFKRRTAEVVKALVDYNVFAYHARMDGCKRHVDMALNYV